MIDSTLIWDEIKAQIEPSEVEQYSRSIGVARISRNEDAFQELHMLLQMQNTVQSDINDEIEKKNPPILSTTQRTKAIETAIHFLDRLREKGHLVQPQNESDSQILNYLKFSKLTRPNSGSETELLSSRSLKKSHSRLTHSARSNGKDMAESIKEIQNLLDEEYQKIQTDTDEIRLQLFSSYEQLNEIKALQPPSTDSIQSFTKKLKSKDVTLEQLSKQTRSSSSVSRLRESIRLNRMWE